MKKEEDLTEFVNLLKKNNQLCDEDEFQEVIKQIEEAKKRMLDGKFVTEAEARRRLGL